MIITYDILKNNKAFYYHIDSFKIAFPNGVELDRLYNYLININDLSFLSWCVMTLENRVEKLKEFSISDKYWIRRAVARNKYTPIDVLTKLVYDKEDEVKKGICLNKSITKELIDVLSNDNSDHTIISLINNCNVSIDVLKRIYEKWINIEHNEFVLISISNSKNITQDLIEKLYKNNSVFVRIGIAENENTINELILQELSIDKHPLVVSSVLNNKNFIKKSN